MSVSIDPKKQALSDALGTRNKANIEAALFDILKTSPYNPAVSSALQENLQNICDLDTTRAGVSADNCIKLLSECIGGNTSECYIALFDLTKQIEGNGLVFGPNFKNETAIRGILRGLLINTTENNPMEEWKTRINKLASAPTTTSENKEIINKVLGSTAIIKLLSTFIIKIKNPELIPSTPGHDNELHRLMGTTPILPPRGGLARSRPNDYGAIPPRTRGPRMPSDGREFVTKLRQRNDPSFLKDDYLNKDLRTLDKKKKDHLNPSEFRAHGVVKTRPTAGEGSSPFSMASFLSGVPVASSLPSSVPLSASGLVPRATPSTTPSLGFRRGGGMIGGGMSGFSNNARNVSMIRYFDAIEKNYKMVGGNNHGIKIAPQLRQTYNDFLSQLKSKGKKIEENDHRTIQEMLNGLEYTEDRLSKVSSYIIRYNELKDDPRFTDLLAREPITVDILRELETKYQELSTKVSSKGLAAKSALEQINKVLTSTSQDDFITNSDELLRSF